MVKVNNPIIQEPVSSLICCFLYDDNTGLKQVKLYLECYLRFFLLVKANKDNFIDESNILSRHYVLTVNSKIIRTRLCSKLTIKTPERRYLSSTLIIFHLVHHSINVF